MTANIATTGWMKLYYSQDEARELGTIRIQTADGKQHLCTDFTTVKNEKASQGVPKESRCPHDGKIISTEGAIFAPDDLYMQRVTEKVNKAVPS